MTKIELIAKINAAGFEPFGGEAGIEDAGRIWIAQIYSSILPLEGVTRLLDAQGVPVVSNGVFLRWNAATSRQLAVYEFGIRKA